VTKFAATEEAARWQSADIPRVGWIWAGRSAGNPIEVAGFRQGLKELGERQP
jgi:putative ABC transport system substrate-binding protein